MRTEFIRSWIKSVRQYRAHDYRSDIVCKVWNRGMGRLDLFRFYPEKKIVLVNSAICNRADERHLDAFLRTFGMQDYKRKRVNYGYPVYYNHSFGLHLAA